MSVNSRSVRSPKSYQNQPDGRINLYNQTYIGFVKEIADATYMGRLKVWIPELNPNHAVNNSSSTNADAAAGADGNSPDQWITVSYCSPFAGATPVDAVQKDSQDEGQSQQSYGWWAVPPHPGNEVVVVFANGDPNRGLWVGCLYQQRMNHMVPAIGASEVYQGPSEAEDQKSPSVEYNKTDATAASADPPIRPRFTALHTGLEAQGLYTDEERGPASTSARRNIPVQTSEGNSHSSATASHTYGYVTPRGNTIHIDDNPDNEFIRLRTRSGAQVLINENIGYIYMISKNGNSWFEISDEGINAFTTRTFNVRAMQGTNFHTEGNTTINSVGGTNMTGSTGSIQVAGDLDIVVPGSFRVSTAGSIHLNSMGDINLTSAGNSSVLSSGTLALQSSGALGVTSSGQVFLNGSKINQNGGAGPAATQAEGATAPEPAQHPDIEVNQGAGYPPMVTTSSAAMLPTHEPWPYHPQGETPPDTIAPNASVSNTNELDSSGAGASAPGSETADGAATVSNLPDPQGRYIYPMTGRVRDPAGYVRNRGTSGAYPHGGCDIFAATGTPVVAAQAGTVVFTSVGRKGSYGTKGSGSYRFGTVVAIKHADGYVTVYAHLHQKMVQRGARVTQGQQIGTCGQTGMFDTPAHLHFELHVGSYLNRRRGLYPQHIFKDMGRRGAQITRGKPV